MMDLRYVQIEAASRYVARKRADKQTRREDCIAAVLFVVAMTGALSLIFG